MGYCSSPLGLGACTTLFVPLRLESLSLSPLEGLQSDPTGPQGLILWGFPVPLKGLPDSLESQMGSSEPSQEYQNFFDTVVLQSVGHPPGGYGIRFGLDCVPPTISLQLLRIWRWHIYFFFFDGPPVDGCSTASCNFGALAGDERTSFFLLHHLATILI